MASSSSLSEAAIVLSPTGPPEYFCRIVSMRLRSTSSSPCPSTPSICSASFATARVMWPCARTWAKSRARRSSRLATRGVPRLRRAISKAPSSSTAIPRIDAEPRPQRRSHQSRAGRGPDQREAVQDERMNPRPGALSDHQINPVIFHRRVQDFLDRGNQAVNFIEEENFTLLERSEDRGQVALAFQQRAGTGLDHDAQLAGDDLRERRLAQAGRAVQQHVVERFAA